MKVYKNVKDNISGAPENFLKTKKAARISKIELNLDLPVREIFTFSQN